MSYALSTNPTVASPREIRSNDELDRRIASLEREILLHRTSSSPHKISKVASSNYGSTVNDSRSLFHSSSVLPFRTPIFPEFESLVCDGAVLSTVVPGKIPKPSNGDSSASADEHVLLRKDRSTNVVSEYRALAATRAAHFVDNICHFLVRSVKCSALLSLGFYFFVIHVGIIFVIHSILLFVSIIAAAIIEVLGSSMWIRVFVFIITPTVFAVLPTAPSNSTLKRVNGFFFNGLLQLYLVMLATIRDGLAGFSRQDSKVIEIHRD
jgi:hypothetical protein